ncbi:type IV pilin protein [Clostridium saudiense]|uniref:type IV pilin protein n=1 Tax=Clostridium saudiense TaxID=1414720 RepID=UPI0018A8BF34|nr:prepilin-type N-terminal cleavage/methylation domain-containing protein [Clostridium saudiense]
MRVRNKKKAFTIIELMAVIAIIAILSAVLVPTVSGYINRTKKSNIVVQSRNVLYYILSSGEHIDNNSKLKELIDKGLLDDYEGKYDLLQSDIEYKSIKSIVADQEAVNKIKIENGKIIEWTGENPYKKK